MTVSGRRRRRRLASGVVGLVVLGVLAVGQGPGRHSDPPLERRPEGLPAGEADEIVAAPPWWRSPWPEATGPAAVHSPERPDGAPGPRSGLSPGADPGSGPGPGLGPGAAMGPVQTATGTQPPSLEQDGRPPPLPVHDVEPEHSPEWVRHSEEGFEVSRGTSHQGSGPVVTYTVELEPAVGGDLLAFTAAVEEALHDPRSWARDHTLRRIDDPASARIRVLLATPTTVDRLCAENGLDTEGRYSCWNGTFAALNARRWRSGAQDFDQLTIYRRYLVNHEFGHGLGHGHLDCPAPGAAAPVMMQQTISTGGCEPNGWPYPDAPLD